MAAAALAVVTGCDTNRPIPPQGATPPPSAPRESRAHGGEFSAKATAYSIEGKTADGTRAREGVVAADPTLLPLGSRIRIEGAGPYSGEYVVEDTGRAVHGHEVDIYLRDDREAKNFGTKNVTVRILERGKGRDGRPDDVAGPGGR